MIINKKSDLKTIKEYLFEYRGIFFKRSYEIFMLIIISMVVMQNVRSLKFLFEKFISKHIGKSLNSFYYFLNDKNHSIEDMIKVTTKIAKSLMTKDNNCIFLSIDDTLIPKYGDKFENRYKLFDHAKRNGSLYINGHCVVSLAMTLPMGEKSITIPLGYKLYDKSCTKLDLAKELIETAMTQLNEFKIVVLCDSWYTNSKLLELANKYENLEITGAVRSNTVLFDLKPEKTGQRGRPREKGDRLNYKDFKYVKDNDLYVSTIECLTNLYDKPVMITVTTNDTTNFKSVRFYLSTEKIEKEKTEIVEEKRNNKVNSVYDVYRNRWNIEVMFYQQKTFWSLETYMVRSKVGIEKYINLIGISYAMMVLIPFISDMHKEYKFCSVQEIKYAFSERIMNELFFSKILKFQLIKENLTSIPELREFNDSEDLVS